MPHRGLTLWVHPGSRAKHDQMLRTAGACRRIWNEALAICKQQYQDHKEGKADKPSVTFVSLCKLYVQLKQALPWLGELHAHTVRSTLKHLAEAYKWLFAGAGFSDWKRKYKDTPQFTVPERIKIEGQKIYIPKIGWVRMTGQNPYADCQPKQAMFKYEAGDWYGSILYAVPETRPDRPAKPVYPIGIDRNVGQVALSTEVMYELPGLAKLDAKLRRLQKKLA